jgi:hypothetical protein
MNNISVLPLSATEHDGDNNRLYCTDTTGTCWAIVNLGTLQKPDYVPHSVTEEGEPLCPIAHGTVWQLIKGVPGSAFVTGLNNLAGDHYVVHSEFSGPDRIGEHARVLNDFISTLFHAVEADTETLEDEAAVYQTLLRHCLLTLPPSAFGGFFQRHLDLTDTDTFSQGNHLRTLVSSLTAVGITPQPVLVASALPFVPAAAERLAGDWEPTEKQSPVAFAATIMAAELNSLPADDENRLPTDLTADVFAEALLQAIEQQVVAGNVLLPCVAAMIKADGRCSPVWDVPLTQMMDGHIQQTEELTG